VLTLIDGRSELIEEVASAAPDLRTYIRDELSELRTEASSTTRSKVPPLPTVRRGPVALGSSKPVSTSFSPDPWGNKWGNMPHRFQPIPAGLDPPEAA
jgi:hypothetical protein